MRSFKAAAVSVLCALILACTGCRSGPEPSQENGTEPGGDVVEMECFINHPWYFTDSYSGIIPQAITEKTGVRLKVTRAVDERQLGRMLASGDLPELIYSETELDRLSDPAVSYPYNELIALYAPGWEVDELLAANARSYSLDKNYYFLLNIFSAPAEWARSPGSPQVPSLGYRADLLEALGSPPLETMEDLLDICAMVKAAYPDKIPIVSNPGLKWRMMPFRVWMGIGSREFTELEDGTVLYFINHPAYKDFCRFVNTLYRNGYIDPITLTLTDPDSKKLVQTAQCFSYCGFSQGEMYRFGEMSRSIEPGARIEECPPLGEGRYFIDSIGFSGLAITRANRHPDRAIRFVEYLHSEEGQRLAQWGREGIEWTWGSDGFPVFSEEWLEAAADENVLYTKYNPSFYFGTSAAVEATGRLAVLSEDYRAVYREFDSLAYFCPWLTAARPNHGSEEKVILDQLTALWETGEMQIFLAYNDDEFERQFRKFLEDARQIGVEKLEAYMNERVLQVKPLYLGSGAR